MRVCQFRHIRIGNSLQASGSVIRQAGEVVNNFTLWEHGIFPDSVNANAYRLIFAGRQLRAVLICLDTFGGFCVFYPPGAFSQLPVFCVASGFWINSMIFEPSYTIFSSFSVSLGSVCGLVAGYFFHLLGVLYHEIKISSI